MHLDPAELALIDGWQRNFPLLPRPYLHIAHTLGLSEAEVIDRLCDLRIKGILARVGATIRPNTAGASTLAAMRVKAGRLEEGAGIVSEEPFVNHNYEREHDFNLWFVITAADRAAVDSVLSRIRGRTGLDVLDLPLVRSFWLDLGFTIQEPRNEVSRSQVSPPARAVHAHERALLTALSDGLALEPRPFRRLARGLATSEGEVLRALNRLIADGIISRLGLIVRHRALGFTANAMAVFDVPDENVERIGARFARESAVSLCYERPRRTGWRFNLFTMVHGRDRSLVIRQIEDMADRAGARELPRAILFSRRCFKQTGATLRAA